MDRRRFSLLASFSLLVGAAFVTTPGCVALVGLDALELDTSTTAQCALPSDCPETQTCLYGRCAESCRVDRDCPVGARCLTADQRSACVTASTAVCRRNEDCGDGATCYQGQCRTSCEPIALPCVSGQACVSSVCIGTDPSRDPSGAGDGSAGTAGTGSDGGAGGGGGTGSNGGTGGSGGGTGTLGEPCGPDAACAVGTRCDLSVTRCATPIVAFDGAAAEFTRASTATYRTGIAELGSAAENELRRENRGDGDGAWTLLEEPRCNRVSTTPASWPTANGTLSTVVGVAPDGTNAAKLTATSDSTGPSINAPATVVSGDSALTTSVWLRSTRFAESRITATLQNSAQSNVMVPTAAFGHFVLTNRKTATTSFTGSVVLALGWDGSGGSAVRTPSIGDALLLAGLQVESGAFATSLAPSCAAGGRKQERLRVDFGTTLGKRFHLALWPAFDAETMGVGERAVFATGPSDGTPDGIFLVSDGGSVRVRVRAAGQTRESTSFGVTAHARLLLAFDPSGKLAVNGVAQSIGAFALPSGTLLVGRTEDAVGGVTRAFSGRISEPFAD